MKLFDIWLICVLRTSVSFVGNEFSSRLVNFLFEETSKQNQHKPEIDKQQEQWYKEKLCNDYVLAKKVALNTFSPFLSISFLCNHRTAHKTIYRKLHEVLSDEMKKV
jgi:hypothetical protein